MVACHARDGGSNPGGPQSFFSLKQYSEVAFIEQLTLIIMILEHLLVSQMVGLGRLSMPLTKDIFVPP